MTRGEWDALQEQYDAFAEALAVSANGLDLSAHKALRQASEQLERVGQLIARAAGFDDQRKTLPGDEAVQYAHDAAFVKQHPAFVGMTPVGEGDERQWVAEFHVAKDTIFTVTGRTPQQTMAAARRWIEEEANEQ